MGSSSQLHEMLEPKYGLLPQCSRVLEQPHSHEILVNCLWLLANMTADSDKMCKRIIRETNLLESLHKFTEVDAISQLDYSLVDMITWLIQNIAKYCKKFDLDQESVS